MSALYLKSRLLLLVFGFAVAFPTSAHAYLDPGSGSMLLQVLLGGTAGLAILLKLYWHRFLLLFGIQQPEDTQLDAIAPPTPDNAQAETEADARPE